MFLGFATVILLLIGLVFGGVGGAQGVPLAAGSSSDAIPARIQPIPQDLPEASVAAAVTHSVGSGSVSVIEYCDGILCGRRNIILSAFPATGWSFGGWTGYYTGTSAYVVLNLGYGMWSITPEFTATFTADPQYLHVGAETGGTAAAAPPQVSYIYGDVVTLTATPDAGWLFTGWTGDRVSSVNPYSMVITGHTWVTATFTPATYTLDVYQDGTGNGSVTKDPDLGSYFYGDVVTLTASTTDDCNAFIGWSGDITGSELVKIITITSNTVVTATFDVVTATITENVVGGGFITSQPDHPNLVCGDVLTFTASSYNGWYFVGWEGAVTGSALTQTMTITNPNVVVTATFEPFSYTLTVNTVGQGSVSKDPDQAAYIYDDEVTLTATPIWVGIW
ncbi:MAG: InlB B-repeat-containing protein [Armatimonadota bacterium]